jgi:flagellar motor switch protein FliG
LAAKLLGTIDPSSKQQLRRTMASLSDVDPMERHRVVEAFRISIGQAANQPDPTHRLAEDTFESSRRDVSAAAPAVLKNAFPETTAPGKSQEPAEAKHEPDSPLAFLGDVPDADLADLMKDEHPQAVALVLASVEPQKAGSVLALLPERLRSQSLSRIGRLGEIPAEAAADLAGHFQSRISKATSMGGSPKQSTVTGQRKLDAILASMNPRMATSPDHPTTPSVAANPQAPNPQAPNPQAPNPHSPMQTSRPAPPNHATAEQAAIELSHRLRVVSDDDSNADVPNTRNHVPRPSPTLVQNEQVTAQTVATHPAVHAEQTASVALDSTDAIHTQLVNLTPVQLCQSLGRVDTRQAMLCLCGLPNQVAESALAVLPKNQAKTVRMQMTQLNSLNLRDIDEAKEQVAQASLQVVPRQVDQPVQPDQPTETLAVA